LKHAADSLSCNEKTFRTAATLQIEGWLVRSMVGSLLKVPQLQKPSLSVPCGKLSVVINLTEVGKAAQSREVSVEDIQLERQD